MKKNNRRLPAFLLALLLLVAWTAPALAAGSGEVYIRTAQDLVELSRSCSLDSWSVGKTVYLEADIDLSGADFQPIPIFAGTFEGQGHTISGFSLTGSGDERGFFRYVQSGAVVRDLTVSGIVSPSDRKDSIGGLAGVNSGSLINCAFSGTVKAGANVGGIAGRNEASGRIINCSYSGTLLGEHYVGGVVGLNKGSVVSCRNEGNVNVTEVKATVAIDEVDLSTIRSTESAPACTDVGGIAGASSGILQSCVNTGDVGYEHVGYNVGGIAGRQSGWLDSCVNTGSVKGRKDVGGVCGQMEPRLTLLFDQDSLDELWDALDTLQALMDKAISDAEGASDTVSDRLTGVSDSADAVREAASGLSGAMTDWADGSIETVNDASARISWTLDRMEPISDLLEGGLDAIQTSAGQAEKALDRMEEVGSLAGQAGEDVRQALEGVDRAAEDGVLAMAGFRQALDGLRQALGDDGAVGQAMTQVGAVAEQLAASFGALSDALEQLWTALEALYGQSGGGTDWTEVVQALGEVSQAAGQINTNLAAVGSAVSAAAGAAGDQLKTAMNKAAESAGLLRSGFEELETSSGHLKDAVDQLELARPYGEEAAVQCKAAAESLKKACEQFRQAGDAFDEVMTQLADQPEISFTPVGDAVGEQGDALETAMGGLSGAMQELNGAISSSSQLLLEDLRAINNQFGVVISVLRGQSDSARAEESGEEGLVEDVSDQATETDEDAGRVTNAQNTGAVEGDVNVGGVVGSMAIEYDYDPEDDLTASGDRSLDFHYQAAALTEGCVNSGAVTGKKDYVGGVVGRVDLGTVSRCESYAPVESTGGDYVGGIAGAAWSTIRDCWTRCSLSGTDCVGGVAGLGKTVTDCRALVEIQEGSACLGAVLGSREKGGQVSGNLFTHDQLGGIDGVSYQGQAEPVDFETLSQGAPEDFISFCLTFRVDGQVVETFEFTYGEALDQLPEIPEREGYSASWPDLDYSHLTFSQTLDAEYTAYVTALTALGDPPQIVVRGNFGEESTLSASYEDESWTDQGGQTHSGQVYTVAVTDPDQPVSAFELQYKLSGGSGTAELWVCGEDGWQRQQAQQDGSYLLFQVEGDQVSFAVEEEARTGGTAAAAAGAAAVAAAAAAAVLLLRHRRTSRKKTAP